MEILIFMGKVIAEIQTIFSNPAYVLTILLFLSIATYTDIKSLKIPNKLNVAFITTRLLFFVATFIPALKYSIGAGIEVTHIVGGVIGFLFLLMPAMALMHKMGGDIKIMAVLGTYLGGYATVLFLLIACIYNLSYCAITIYGLKLKTAKSVMPFAPFFLASFLSLGILFYFL